MTTNIDTTTLDKRLAELRNDIAALNVSRTQAQQQVDACAARMDVLARRISAMQVATTTLASLAPLAPETEWRDHLSAWRKTLCDELLALPPRIRDPHLLGVQQNVTLSIRTIDFGTGVLNGSGYELQTLRLGRLMRESGYEPEGADPDCSYGGVMPWFGSLPEVERRIAVLQKRREAAQAQLDEALLDDAERERLAAEGKARREGLNAAPQRKVRGDGSQYERYPDGRVVEVTA